MSESNSDQKLAKKENCRSDENAWLRLSEFHHRVEDALKSFSFDRRVLSHIPSTFADVVFYGHDLGIWRSLDQTQNQDHRPEPLLWQCTKNAFRNLIHSQLDFYLSGFSSVIFLDNLRTDHNSFLHMEVDCPVNDHQIDERFIKRSAQVIYDGLAFTYLALLTPLKGSLPSPEQTLFPVVLKVSLDDDRDLERSGWADSGALQVSVDLQSSKAYLEADELPDWRVFPKPRIVVHPPGGFPEDILYSRVRAVYPGLENTDDIDKCIAWNCAHHLLGCRESCSQRAHSATIIYVPSLPVGGATSGVATVLDSARVRGKESQCMLHLLLLAEGIGNSIHALQQQMRFKAANVHRTNVYRRFVGHNLTKVVIYPALNELTILRQRLTALPVTLENLHFTIDRLSILFNHYARLFDALMSTGDMERQFSSNVENFEFNERMAPQLRAAFESLRSRLVNETLSQHLRLEEDYQRPCELRCDSTFTTEVLFNLLSNAVSSIEPVKVQNDPGRATIALKTYLTVSNGREWCVFQVKDRGKGFADSVKASFEKIQRELQNTKQHEFFAKVEALFEQKREEAREGHVSVGLILCAAYLRQLEWEPRIMERGSITIRSDLGQGSIVTVELPLAFQ